MLIQHKKTCLKVLLGLNVVAVIVELKLYLTGYEKVLPFFSGMRHWRKEVIPKYSFVVLLSKTHKENA